MGVACTLLLTHAGMQHDGCMAGDAGVGFTDVGSGIPGTQSSQFDSATFQSWGSGFYSRLAAHVARACDSIGYVFNQLINVVVFSIML